MKIRILSDTAADCLQQEIDNYGIDIFELPVTFDGEEEACSDLNEFWSKLIDGKTSHTSQPSPEVLRTYFTAAQEAGDAVVCITISSKLSGTYDSILSIKEELGYDNLFIVDSQNATAGEKVLAFEACKLRDKGFSAQEIANHLETLKSKIRIYACIDTLKYLARGGRISKTSAAIGTLINIKPLIEVTDGEVRTYGKTIGTKVAMHKIVDRMISDGVDWNYAPIPIYSYNSENCISFVNHAKSNGLTVDEKNLTPIGATIGTHVGPGGFGIVFVAK